MGTVSLLWEQFSILWGQFSLLRKRFSLLREQFSLLREQFLHNGSNFLYYRNMPPLHRVYTGFTYPPAHFGAQVCCFRDFVGVPRASLRICESLVHELRGTTLWWEGRRRQAGKGGQLRGRGWQGHRRSTGAPQRDVQAHRQCTYLVYIPTLHTYFKYPRPLRTRPLRTSNQQNDTRPYIYIERERYVYIHVQIYIYIYICVCACPYT